MEQTTHGERHDPLGTQAAAAVIEPVTATPSESSNKPKVPKGPGKPVKRRGALYVAAAGVVTLGYFGIAPRIRQGHKLAAEVDSLKTETPSVNTVTLKPTTGASSFTLPSNITAIDETVINAQTRGYVRARYVDIGSHVEKGQVLAEIESPEVDQQLSEAQAEAARAAADLGQAQAGAAKLLAAVTAARSDESHSVAVLMQARASLAHYQAKELQAESELKVSKSKQVEVAKRLLGSKADLNRAKAGLTIAQKTLDRWKQLEKGDAVSGQDVDEKEADYERNGALVESANADVSSAEADVQGSSDAVQSAGADVQAAKADVSAGVQSVNAAQSSLASSKANVDAALASYRASQSNVQAAQASVRAQQANVGRIQAMQSFERITAPFAGVITARNVDVGDLVNPSSGGTGASDQGTTVTKTGLFGLARTDELRVQVNVPEGYVASIHNGGSAEITVAEFPNRTFRGQIFNLSGALDAVSRTLLVEVRVPNPDHLLKPGMYAQIQFLNIATEASIHIPANALIFDASGTRVATVTPDGTMRYVKVKLGRDFGDQIEVLQGLRGDETIVTNPDDTLQEGEKVKALPQAD